MCPAGGTSPVPSPCPFPYDFSLWYFPEDADAASSIAERLRREGFRGFTEHQDQVAGTSVILTAVEVIEASRVAILLLSARSVGDPWCQRVSEWNLVHAIHRRGTKVVPVCVGVTKAEVPPFLQHLIALDYQSEFFFESLLASLRSQPGSRARRVPRKGTR